MSTQPVPYRTIPSRKLVNGKFIDAEPSVVIETELRIIVNGDLLATASIMPGMEREFVTGYLFGQGFINAPNDLAGIEIEKDDARISLCNGATTGPDHTSYRIVSGGGRTAFRETPLLHITSDLKVERDNVFTAMNRLFEIASVYKETEGVHAAGLFTTGAEPVRVVEDIGRHNCLDKVIGYGLLNNIDMRRCLLVSTGRMASEMVAKLCRAGIPVTATKTAVTEQGLTTAQACGMTLIGFVRDTGNRIHTDMETRVISEPVMKIYCGEERIVFTDL